jgi:hypothetical protein
MPVLGEATFEAAVQKVMRQQNVNRASAERIVGSAEKKQKKARLLKLRMAAVGISFDEKMKRREKVNKPKKTVQGTELYNVSNKPKNEEMTQRRLKQEKGYINTGAPIRPTKTDMKTDVDIRRRLASLDSERIKSRAKKTKFDRVREPLSDATKKQKSDEYDALEESQQTGRPINPKSYNGNKINLKLRKKLAQEQRLAKEHGHAIVFKGIPHGPYKVASLNEQSGRYAKYWLLNAKQTNGNGWGIAAHTAKDNMKKFLGRPLVVTSASWHGASEYGNSYEHPYLPTNDLNKIFDHQEKFRVGSIIDVQEDKAGDWYATIEMLPKFANMNLPPFCSPAIYQLDASEHEGQISKWEALHLAALDENPAYGARIALLKGSCVGTKDSCTVQFKSAKQLNATIYDEDVANSTKKQKKKKMFDKNNPKFRGIMEAQVVCPKKVANIKEKIANLKKKQKVAIVRSPDKPQAPREMKHTRVDSAGPLINKVPFGDEDRSTTQQYIDRQMRDSSYELGKGKKVYPPKPTQRDRKRIIKAKLASLGEQNMTYQNSKKVKIHKKKHPEVRKAKNSVEDILRKAGRSIDASHHQSTFLSTKGDFIGGGDIHDIQIRNILDPTGAYGETVTNDFIKQHNLGRVQNFPINRAGEKKTSVHFNSKVNRNQLKAIEDLEIGGRDIGYAVGSGEDIATGRGYRDLTKTLRERGLL